MRRKVEGRQKNKRKRKQRNIFQPQTIVGTTESRRLFSQKKPKKLENDHAKGKTQALVQKWQKAENREPEKRFRKSGKFPFFTRFSHFYLILPENQLKGP